MENGSYVVGKFVSLVSEPWANNSERFNHRVVVANEYSDRYGMPQTDITTIDINQEDLPVLQQQAPRIQGKQVMVPVIYRIQLKGVNGPWLSVRMPKGSRIQFPSQPADQQQKAG